jgi:hypothetical protein
MKNVFDFRDSVIGDYSRFSRSFTRISAPDIKRRVDAAYEKGRYWPEPLMSLRWIDAKHLPFLRWHREHLFQQRIFPGEDGLEAGTTQTSNK